MELPYFHALAPMTLGYKGLSQPPACRPVRKFQRTSPKLWLQGCARPRLGSGLPIASAMVRQHYVRTVPLERSDYVATLTRWLPLTLDYRGALPPPAFGLLPHWITGARYFP